MPICAVITCRNKSATQNLTRGGVSYHRFPRVPNVREKWILATGRQNWIPTKVATICSNHFEPRHFVAKTGERRYLNSLAVPCHNVCSSRDVQQHRMVSSSLDVNPSSSSAAYNGTSPLLYTSLSEGTSLSPVNVLSSSAPTDNDVNDAENVNGVTSIEVEIMPENRIILRPQEHKGLIKPDVNMNSQTREEDKRAMELMQAKIQEQDLLIRKLKVRNYRLKKRLFSLKSMEAMES